MMCIIEDKLDHVFVPCYYGEEKGTLSLITYTHIPYLMTLKVCKDEEVVKRLKNKYYSGPFIAEVKLKFKPGSHLDPTNLEVDKVYAIHVYENFIAPYIRHNIVNNTWSPIGYIRKKYTDVGYIDFEQEEIAQKNSELEKAKEKIKNLENILKEYQKYEVRCYEI